jgi:hypothetical protein
VPCTWKSILLSFPCAAILMGCAQLSCGSKRPATCSGAARREDYSFSPFLMNA